MAIFKKINFGLSKTRNKMSGAIDDMLDSFDELSDDMYGELEEVLVMSDVGVETAVTIVEELKSRVRSERIKRPDQVKGELENIIAGLLEGGEDMGLITVPSILLMIGVNGVGKTTTIGKLASMYKAEGKKVILGAADTFRAAAIEQLDEWATRAGVDIVKHKEGADPAAVIFDTISAGKSRDCDIIICDTAGRLHNKKNLMDELAKIYRVIDRELPYSDREILLVLDATTGQNAVNQAREFMNVAELTGIVLTKLDGTARGGVVLSIKNELKLPVKFIGVGEGIDDLQPFDPHAFAKSLFVEGTDHTEEDAEIEKYISENGAGEIDFSDTEVGAADELRSAVKDLFEALSDAGTGNGEVGNDTAEETVEGGAEVSAEEEQTAREEEKIKEEEARQAREKAIEEERKAAAKAAAEAAEKERIRKEAERKAKEEAERKAREEAERRAREEAERRAREEAERRAREEAERRAREEAERRAKEEAERRAKEEAERRAKEEAERKAKEEAEAKAVAEAKAEAARIAEELIRQAEEKKNQSDEKKKRGLFGGLFGRNS